MLLVELTRNQRVEAVDEWKIHRDAPAVFFSQRIVMAVEPMARGEVRVAHHLGPEHFAILQRGHECFVKFGKLNAAGSGHDFQFGCEPADTEFVLEQCVNPIKSPSRSAASDHEPPALSAQHKTVGAEFAEID